MRDKFKEIFQCERLLDTDKNRNAIDSFECERNPQLARHLRKEAWSEEISNKSKHYIVKDRFGDIMFYFSLRCGSISECIGEQLIEVFNKMPKISKAFKESDYVTIQEIADEMGISSDFFVKNINKLANKADTYEKEMMSASSEKSVYRVLKSMSSVELVQFCANSAYTEKWLSLGFPISRGAAVFWFFVVPIIQDIQFIVGCEYMHLFAADMSEEQTLCSYYSNDLGFKFIDNLALFKPFYDFECIPMYLDATNIEQLAEEKIQYLIGDIDKELETE